MVTQAESTQSRGYRAVLSFPRTRTALRWFFSWRRLRILGWWLFWLVFIDFVWALLRGAADNAGLPVHGAALERGLFGGLPSLWLQENVYEQAPVTLRWASTVVHGSWFIVPVLAGVLVTWKAPSRIGSFFRWWTAVYLICLVGFVLFPLEPPWMADSNVVRINELVVGDIRDPNPVAALPSLHVALPLTLAFWFFRENWRLPGTLLIAYALVVTMEVILSGEHYVIDALGSVAAASVVAVAATRFDYRRVFSRLPRLQPRLTAGSRVPQGAPVLETVRARQRWERGQAIIEMVLVLPLIFVFILLLADFGIALDRREVLQHAVREGARYGSVGHSIADIQQRTSEQSQTLLNDPAMITVCYADDPGDAETVLGNPGDDVRVSVDFTYNFSLGSDEMLAFWGLDPISIDINPSADMRLENAATVAAGDAC